MNEIEELTELDDLRALVELFSEVWGSSGDPPLNSNTLRAMAHSGNHIAGVRADGRLIAGIVGWLGIHAPDDLHLHSHILGVLPGHEAKGLGFALKQHQRTWCLERGVRAVEWTFDPLVRRNAHFNLAKLGAEASRYLVDFYGGMRDGINAGDETDRILIRWDLESQNARAAAAGHPVEPEPGPDAVLVQVPEDIVAIRRHDPELARRWRLDVREALTGPMARGYRITGFTRTFEYVLERG
jgi:predicted GNAT superfamily acetyltransferase